MMSGEHLPPTNRNYKKARYVIFHNINLMRKANNEEGDTNMRVEAEKYSYTILSLNILLNIFPVKKGHNCFSKKFHLLSIYSMR